MKWSETFDIHPFYYYIVVTFPITLGAYIILFAVGMLEIKYIILLIVIVTSSMSAHK